MEQEIHLSFGKRLLRHWLGRAACLLLGCWFCVSAFASEGISPTKIKSIGIYTGYAVITLATPGTNADGCGHASAADYVSIYWADDENAKQLFDVVKDAALQGQELGFGVNGCVAWSGGVPKVYRVDLKL